MNSEINFNRRSDLPLVYSIQSSRTRIKFPIYSWSFSR